MLIKRGKCIENIAGWFLNLPFIYFNDKTNKLPLFLSNYLDSTPLKAINGRRVHAPDMNSLKSSLINYYSYSVGLLILCLQHQ